MTDDCVGVDSPIAIYIVIPIDGGVRYTLEVHGGVY